MSKKLFTVMGLLIIVLVIMACGSSVQVNTPAPNSQSTEQSVTVDQATPTQESQIGTKRSNPAPAGSEVLADDMAFEILSTIRPANKIVSKGNEFNSTPEPTQEYVFVKIQATCKKSTDEQCSIYPDISTKLIGSKGIEYDPYIFLSGVENILSSTDFYGNAVISGYIPFIISKDETDLILVYEMPLGDKFYLALPEPTTE